MFFKNIFVFAAILFFAFINCKVEYNLTDLLTNNLNKTADDENAVKKTWQVIGTTGFSSYTPYTLDIKIDNTGIPMVAYYTTSASFYVYLHEYIGSWNEYSDYKPYTINNEMSMTMVNNQATIFCNTVTDCAKDVVIYNTGGSWTDKGNILYASQPSAITIAEDNVDLLIGYYLTADAKYYIRTNNGSWTSPASFFSGTSIVKSQIQKKAGNYYLCYKKSDMNLWIRTNTISTSLISSPETNISSNVINFSMSVAGNGIAYIAYIDTTDNKILHFASFNGSLTNNVFPDLILSNTVNNPSIIVVDTGRVFLLVAIGSVDPVIKVFFFNGTVWLNCGPDVGIGYTGVPPAIDLAPDGTPYVAYSDNYLSLGGKITVKAFK